MKKISFLIAILAVPYLIYLWQVYADSSTKGLIFIVTIFVYALIWRMNIKFYKQQTISFASKIVKILIYLPIIIYAGYRIVVGQNNLTLEMIFLSSFFGIFFEIADKINSEF